MNRSRIATLVRIRSLQERVARAGLIQSRAALVAAANDESRLWLSIDTVGSTFGAKGSPGFLAARETVIDAGVGAARTAAGETARARNNVFSAEHVWTAAARREEALERLFDKVVSEEESDRVRVAANELDDIVAAAHVRTLSAEVGR